jgi:hypothetical protein
VSFSFGVWTLDGGFVPFQVFNRRLKNADVVTRIAEHRVATIAEQAADCAGFMVVVNAELPVPVVAAAADGADAALRFQHREELVMGDTEPALAGAPYDLRTLTLRRFGAVLRAVFVAAAEQLWLSAAVHLADAVGQAPLIAQAL